MHHAVPRPLVAALSGAVVVSSLVVAASVPATAGGTSPSPLPSTVTADALPTWQLNGVVWSQAVVGRTVYAAGAFTRARPPGVAPGGTGEIPVANVFAYDIVTGSRVPTFSHSLNGQALVVKASPDGRRVYVGGDFTKVDGVARSHLAAFDTKTHALVADFAPTVSSRVAAIAVTSSAVYLGGSFGTVNGVAKANLAAVTTSDGKNLSGWGGSVTGPSRNVLAMTMTPDQSRVIVGGSFTELRGVPAVGMGSLDARTGAVQPWAANQDIRNSGTNAAITTLRADATTVYGGAYKWVNGSANFEGTFAADPMTGAIKWANDCHGDTYDVAPIGTVLYAVSHAHDCRPIGGFPDSSVGHRAMAYSMVPAGFNKGPDSYGWDHRDLQHTTILNWFPDMTVGSYTGKGQAAWSIAGNSQYVVLGGEFPTVNGKRQQGLVRFAVSGTAPGKIAPAAMTSAPAVSRGTGTIRLSWRAVWDKDDSPLRYEVWRDDDVMPAGVVSAPSTFWQLPSLSFTDTGQPNGTVHKYRVRVLDPDGNASTSPTVSVTATGGSNRLPVAAPPTVGCTSRTCQYSATGSSDLDGEPLTYGWDFGDGSPYATGATATHSYLLPGRYTVRLSVRDSRGGTRTVSALAVASSDPVATRTRLRPTAPLVAGDHAVLTTTVTPFCAGRIVIDDGGRRTVSVTAAAPSTESRLGKLRAGVHTLRAHFRPAEADRCTASSDVLRVAVAKAASTTTLKVDLQRLRHGKRAKAVAIINAETGARLSGVVRFYDRSRLLAKDKLSKHGVARVKLPGLGAGTHRIRATYPGSSQVRASTSTKIRVKVRRR